MMASVHECFVGAYILDLPLQLLRSVPCKYPAWFATPFEIPLSTIANILPPYTAPHLHLYRTPPSPPHTSTSTAQLHLHRTPPPLSSPSVPTNHSPPSTPNVKLATQPPSISPLNSSFTTTSSYLILINLNLPSPLNHTCTSSYHILIDPKSQESEICMLFFMNQPKEFCSIRCSVKKV